MVKSEKKVHFFVVFEYMLGPEYCLGPVYSRKLMPVEVSQATYNRMQMCIHKSCDVYLQIM